MAELRKARGLTVRQLADQMTEAGVKLLPSAVTSLEQGKRRATAEEVLALAYLLRVNPNRILFSERAGIEGIKITPTVSTTQHRAWAWADGSWHLDSQYEPGTPSAEAYADFRQHIRPIEQRLVSEHPAVRAARRMLSRVEAMVGALHQAVRPEWDLAGILGDEPADEMTRSMARLKDEVQDLLVQWSRIIKKGPAGGND